MSSILITGLFTVLGALVSGVFMYWSYGRTSKATVNSSRSITKANAKNTLISQNNNLFEESNRLSHLLYQVQHDALDSEQDKIVMFYELKNAVSLLNKHSIAVPKETSHVVRNYGDKLHQDARNSL